VTSEFALIARYFARPAPSGMLGPGDDCALLSVPDGHELAVATDMLLEGRHFLPDIDPADLAYKALAVNLSDLAAMGAQPLGCLLALGLEMVDPDWLQRFSDSLHALAGESGCPLLGGDTTRSLQGRVICVTVLGQVPRGRALRRDAAHPGDDIWITGVLGAPDIALRMLQGRLARDEAVLAATRPLLERPEPPLAFAPQLCGLAHAALDISDGLLQDLGHILKASACGAVLRYPHLPEHPALATLEPALRRQAVLAGGDVYQLCFTAPAAHRERLAGLAGDAGVRLSRVGHIVAEPGLTVLDADDRPMTLSARGFDHFP